MSKRSALFVLSCNGEILLLYADSKNYPKFKAGDNRAMFTAQKLESSLIIEFEDGKPVFDGIAP